MINLFLLGLLNSLSSTVCKNSKGSDQFFEDRNVGLILGSHLTVKHHYLPVTVHIKLGRNAKSQTPDPD